MTATHNTHATQYHQARAVEPRLVSSSAVVSNGKWTACQCMHVTSLVAFCLAVYCAVPYACNMCVPSQTVGNNVSRVHHGFPPIQAHNYTTLITVSACVRALPSVSTKVSSVATLASKPRPPWLMGVMAHGSRLKAHDAMLYGFRRASASALSASVHCLT